MRVLGGLVTLLVVLSGCGAPEAGDDGPAATPTPQATATGSPLPTPSPTPTTTAVPWTPEPWRTVECTATPSQARPDVVLIEAGTLVRLAWNGTGYQEAARGPDATHAAILDGLVVAASPERLLVLDDDLDVVAQEAVQNVTALAAEGGLLYAAHGDWNLTVRGSDLQETGRVRLPPPHGGVAGKMVDAVHVEDGLGYLLDDVIMPFYAFLVDVEAMRVLETVDVPSQGLDRQWVGDGRWWMETRFFGMGGGGEGAAWYRVGEDGAQRGGQVSLNSDRWGAGPDEDRSRAGYDVVANTVRIPSWAVLGIDDDLRLVRMDLQPDGPTKSCDVPLEAGGRAGAVAAQDGVVAVAVGDRLHLVEAGKEEPAWTGPVGQVAWLGLL